MRAEPITLTLMVAALLACRGGSGSAGDAGASATPDDIMRGIHDKVARDAVSQYQLAKKSDDRMQICVQAGLVAAAYLQAKDEKSYLAWKVTEKADCAEAGLQR